MHNPKKKATESLQYYFRLIAERAGINWDSDNDDEVAEIIDNIALSMLDEIFEHERSTHHQE